MKNEVRQAFAARVAQAKKSELIVILYEIILTDIDDAIEAYQKDNFIDFEHSLKQGQKCVNELMATLDYHYGISYELLSLYLYVNREIITAHMKKSIEPLDGVKRVIKKLLLGFEGVSKLDQSETVMKNTQHIYAGLTYGKGKLNETLGGNNSNRGFIA